MAAGAVVALTGDALAALAGAVTVLVVVLIVWLVLHHSRPQLKVDVGVRGWVHLMRPPEPEAGPGPDAPDEEPQH